MRGYGARTGLPTHTPLVAEGIVGRGAGTHRSRGRRLPMHITAFGAHDARRDPDNDSNQHKDIP